MYEAEANGERAGRQERDRVLASGGSASEARKAGQRVAAKVTREQNGWIAKNVGRD